MKKALITGITGQDGSYLAELLIEKGYEVHGIIRRSSTFNTQRLESIYKDPHNANVKLHLCYGDLVDGCNLSRLIEKLEPDEIYNLAAQSHVGVSFELPEYTSNTDAIGTLRLLDAIKEARVNTRIYQASTSELFGKSASVPQNEDTPFRPCSPYAVAKLFAYWMTVNYREAYNLFSTNGILFNHESPRRGKRFVTRKITVAAAKIRAGLQDRLYIGNLDAKRDWGYAPEYVEAMYLMLQCDTPCDLVIATGETHTVREFAEKAFGFAGIEIAWEGSGRSERGVNVKTGLPVIEIDPRYYRPCEVDILLGDPSRAEKTIGWKPRIKFESLAELMIRNDIDSLAKHGESGLDHLE